MHDYGGNWNEWERRGYGDPEGHVLWDRARYTGDAFRRGQPRLYRKTLSKDEFR
jgi:hypothetical protein